MSSAPFQSEAELGPRPAPRLRTRWFSAWTPELGQALAELPEMPTCPHELYRELSQNRTSVRKRLGIVTDRGRPVCVVCLRRRDRHWHLVTDGGVVPRCMAPAEPGYLYPALSALGVDLWVQSIEERPPERWTRSPTPYPFYRISLKGDFERYWRESGHHKTVRQARSHTEGFSFEVNDPGASEWIINGWKQKWGDSAASQASSSPDLLVAARYLQRRNGFHSFRLVHDGEPVAGVTALVMADNGLLMVTAHRLPEYKSGGTRLYDLVFHWAAEAGYDNLDMGSGHAYKERWAPQAGVRWTFNIAPWYLRAAKSVAAKRRPLLRAILRRVRGEAETSES